MIKTSAVEDTFSQNKKSSMTLAHPAEIDLNPMQSK